MKELKESSYVLDKACIFEQLDDVNEIISEIYMSYPKINQKDIELMEKIVRLTLSGEIPDNVINNVIEIARIGGGESKVLTMAQQVIKNEFAMYRKKAKREGRKEGIKEGLKEGLKEGEEIGIIKSIKGMLYNNVDDDIIISSTGISKKELQKIKEDIK